MFNSDFIEEMYNRWKNDTTSVSSDWNSYFVQLSESESSPISVDAPHVQSMQAHVHNNAAHTTALQSRVELLIHAYRHYGYLYAKTNPLGDYLTPQLKHVFYTVEGLGNYLDLKEFGITEAELDTHIQPGPYMQPRTMTVRELINKLKHIYCGSSGVETIHIQNRTMRNWIIAKHENQEAWIKWDNKQYIRLQKDLIKAEQLERFLQSSFIGQKRFSLEGAEVLIPALRYLIDTAINYGVQEIALAMSHRGRLSVFTNALRKRAAETFSDFIGAYQPHTYGGSGDVKYHLGHNFNVSFGEGRNMHISLVANPSHLEAVDAVVVGKCRGIQRRRNDKHRKKVIPILIHGDAAFSGQGVVSELFNLSQLDGYKTGGTIHIIVNNQIGFTTPSRDARSTFFASDIAKILPIPIFHVNGDDPEAVVKAVHLALLYRQKFSFDVVIDIVCYRRLGHNEADEPSFNHPIMYRMIHNHKTVRTLYGERLAQKNIFSSAKQDAFSKKYIDVLKNELDLAKKGFTPPVNDAFQVGPWQDFVNAYSFEPIDTAVTEELLTSVAQKLCTYPADFSLNPKLIRLIDERMKVIKIGEGIDWPFAEHLAFATLLLDGYPIRLSGEDSSRGTFSHRHAVWWDNKSEVPKSYTPLQNLADNQGYFSVYNSPLSEFSVLGYDYGYSLAQPNILVIWEAQFGDFINGAQVIIDQFIASAETKWHRSSGLVMLLPHAFEGQGPEHSSAHLERFLQMCAEDNMQIVNVSTPAQYFHLLRKQMKQKFRKPLIIMSPKSLLRHPRCKSSLEDFSNGHFQMILDDPEVVHAQVERVIFSSGHHYYDLLAEREQLNIDSVAIIRMEQFYPFPEAAIRSALAKYPKGVHVVWSQEESRNRGAFHFLNEGLQRILKDMGFQPFICASRLESASPATGSATQHKAELRTVLNTAFGIKA